MIAFLIPEQITELLVLIWRREGEQRFGFLFFLIFDSVLTFFFFLAPHGWEVARAILEFHLWNDKSTPKFRQTLHSLQKSSVVETQTPVSKSDLTFIMMAWR